MLERPEPRADRLIVKLVIEISLMLMDNVDVESLMNMNFSFY